MKTRYVVALDGSPSSELALEFAAPMAESAGARVVLAHVIEERPPGKVHGQPHLPASAEAARAYLGEMAARWKLDAEIHCEDARGRSLPSALADLCKDAEAVLLLLAPHGPETSISRWLSGSMAQRTAPLAPCPVFIARGAPGLEEGKFRGVYIADDFTPEHETGWRRILTFCARHASSAEILGVFDPENVLQRNPSARFLPSACKELVEAARRFAPDHIAGHKTEIGALKIPVTANILEGDRLDVMATALARHAAWPLILRTHGMRGFAARFEGSFSPRLLRMSPNPVLLVPIGELDPDAAR